MLGSRHNMQFWGIKVISKRKGKFRSKFITAYFCSTEPMKLVCDCLLIREVNWFLNDRNIFFDAVSCISFVPSVQQANWNAQKHRASVVHMASTQHPPLNMCPQLSMSWSTSSIYFCLFIYLFIYFCVAVYEHPFSQEVMK